MSGLFERLGAWAARKEEQPAAAQQQQKQGVDEQAIRAGQAGEQQRQQQQQQNPAAVSLARVLAWRGGCAVRAYRGAFAHGAKRTARNGRATPLALSLPPVFRAFQLARAATRKPHCRQLPRRVCAPAAWRA